MKIRRTTLKRCTLLLMGLFFSTLIWAESCLWKVTSETGTLYVQGSIHLLKAENYPLAPAIEQAYADSEVLVLEVDMNEMTSPQTQQKIMQKALLPTDETLQGLIGMNTYQKLGQTCTQLDLPPATLNRFKPWFAAVTLTLIKTQKMGFDPQYGLDTYFFNQAMADSKKVVGLETVDFQIGLFDDLSSSNPDEFIAHALAELDSLEADMARLEQAWVSGDIAALGMLMSKSFADYPELYQTFVLDRNLRWIEQLDLFLKKPSTHLVVVGAGHLPGQGGLLELLKEKGYTIEQL